MKKYTLFRPIIRSRHPSHNNLRRKNKILSLLPFKSIIRFGSLTDMKDTITNGGDRVEINTTKAIKNSSNKLLMKNCFTSNKIKTADWWKYDDELFWKFGIKDVNNKDILIHNFEDLPYPIISKHIYGSKGKGNKKHNNQTSLEKWMIGKNLDNYIFEKFYNYSKEYRLHVTENGCFYSCRKMLKNDAPQEVRWYRNNDNCVWIIEENKYFDKPVNWDDIIAESIKALTSVGLDIGAIDLKIQSSTDSEGNKRKYPKFIILEINSAPSFGKITEEKYIKELDKILRKNI